MQIQIFNIPLTDTGEWSQARYALHVQPLVAFTRFADAREFRQISAKKREVG